MVALRRLTFATIVASALVACGIDAVGTLADLPGVDRPDPDGTTTADANAGGEGDGASSSDASADADDGASDVFVPGDGGNVALTVTMVGAPAGTTVTSNGGGIDCPGTCSVSVPAGTKLNLTANVSGDVSLSSWSGACVGRDPTCALTVSTTTFVTATFAPLAQYMHSAGTLYTVNVSTGATTLIGALGTGLTSSGDIVWMPGRGVFITLNDAASTDKLGVIDVATGAATVIGTGVGRDAVYSLGYRGGALLGYGNGFSIKIDPVTGAGTTWNASTGIDSYGAASGP